MAQDSAVDASDGLEESSLSRVYSTCLQYFARLLYSAKAGRLGQLDPDSFIGQY